MTQLFTVSLLLLVVEVLLKSSNVGLALVLVGDKLKNGASVEG